MKFELTDNSILKNCFEAIGTIIDEVQIQADSEGLRLRAIDRGHIAFVELELNAILFDEYDCDTPEHLNVDVDELVKILKRCKNDDILKCETTEGKLSFIFEGDSTRRFSVNLIDIEYESPAPPTIELPVSLNLPTTLLVDALEDISIYTENITFSVDEDYFKCNGAGEFGDVESKYIHGVSINEVVASSFTIPKIKDMMKARKLDDTVTLGLGDEMPLTLKFDINGEGELSFLLAPRVDATE